MQMLDIYLRSGGRKNQSMNLRTLNLLGFKVRPRQGKGKKKNWSPEGWTLIVFLFRQGPITTSVNMRYVTTLPHPSSRPLPPPRKLSGLKQELLFSS